MSAREVRYRDRGHRHPAWCNRSLCWWHDDIEVNHNSTPVELLGVDSKIGASLTISDELSFALPWRASLVFQIEDIYSKADPLCVYLSVTDVRALRDLLTEQLDRAEAAELADPAPFLGGECDE